MRLPLLVSFALCLSFSALADDQPYLVRDLPGVTLHDSEPWFWTNIGNTTWFAAQTASRSVEIFKTDGTTAGTVQVTHGIGVPDSQSFGPFLGLVSGKLVYGGHDSGGDGVFALDTAGGDPVLLGRFQTAYLTNGIVRDGTLYFSGRANDEHELWRTNGTPETTSKVDLMPGAQGAFDPANNTELFSAGPWMLFFGVTPEGTGLHRTDGTPGGTALILPLTASALFNNSEDQFVLGGRLLFRLASNQLWATDGSSAGTSQIATLSSSSFTTMGVANGQLFFDGGGIWTTDGTAAGTKKTDIFTGSNGSIHSGYVVGNRLYFATDHFDSGKWTTTLYVTEGTAASTRAIMPVDQHFYIRGEGFAIGNNFYFRHDDGIHGMELWRTDGTTTEMFVDINPGYRAGVDSAYVFPRPDGKVLFAATEFNTGNEPWITDGTAAGTRLLKNCAEEDSFNGSSPYLLRAAGDRLYFVAELTGGQAIGVSDGTAAGTSATIVDFPWTIQNAAAANGRYFFSISTNGLYASDGSAAGTTRIFEQSVHPYALSNGILFSTGSDLWFSDGTSGGTRKAHAFPTGASSPSIFPAGSFAWLTTGARLWKTDGTDAGTVEIVPAPAPTSTLNDALRSGSWTYFIESSAFDHGYRLWRSDGSAIGTTMVKDFGPPQTPSGFIGATDRLVYFTVNGVLYRSDGTEGGTIGLSTPAPCFASGAALGDAFLFTSYAVSSNTLIVWRSDGTAAGTTALATMKPPRSNDAGCRTLTTRGNAVYFSGWDAAHGWELWTSDGTAAGTKMLADIYTGTKSSLPAEMTIARDRLFFSADSANIGRELWALGGPATIRRRAFRP